LVLNMHDSIWEVGRMMIVHVYNLRPNGQHFTLLRGGGWWRRNQVGILAKDEHRTGDR